jgi:hypothetical protein
MEEHLRPHPASVKVGTNLKIKKKFANRTDAFTYAFNDKSYVDFDIYNILKKPTVDRSGVCKAISTSKKPVVFFLCYDVGDNKYVNLFIRHIVCCVAFPSADKVRILFFDMRDLCDISKKHQEHIEEEIGRKCGKKVVLENASCLSNKCIYLQKFKGDYEVGWCIAWALFFLDKAITSDPTLVHNINNIKHFYKHVYSILSKANSNRPIEEWYVKSYQEVSQN